MLWNENNKLNHTKNDAITSFLIEKHVLDTKAGKQLS